MTKGENVAVKFKKGDASPRNELAKLQEHFRDTGLTIAEVCRLSGLSRNSVSAILQGEGVREQTAQKFRNALTRFEAQTDGSSIVASGGRFSALSQSTNSATVGKNLPSSISVEDHFVIATNQADSLNSLLVSINKALNKIKNLREEGELLELCESLDRLCGEVERLKDKSTKLIP